MAALTADRSITRRPSELLGLPVAADTVIWNAALPALAGASWSFGVFYSIIPDVTQAR